VRASLICVFVYQRACGRPMSVSNSRHEASPTVLIHECCPPRHITDTWHAYINQPLHSASAAGEAQTG